jgi:hypothetical protein
MTPLVSASLLPTAPHGNQPRAHGRTGQSFVTKTPSSPEADPT